MVDSEENNKFDLGVKGLKPLLFCFSLINKNCNSQWGLIKPLF